MITSGHAELTSGQSLAEDHAMNCMSRPGFFFFSTAQGYGPTG
jgi:hypothetical protein